MIFMNIFVICLSGFNLKKSLNIFTEPHAKKKVWKFKPSENLFGLF